MSSLHEALAAQEKQNNHQTLKRKVKADTFISDYISFSGHLIFHLVKTG